MFILYNYSHSHMHEERVHTLFSKQLNTTITRKLCMTSMICTYVDLLQLHILFSLTLSKGKRISPTQRREASCSTSSKSGKELIHTSTYMVEERCTPFKMTGSHKRQRTQRLICLPWFVCEFFYWALAYLMTMYGHSPYCRFSATLWISCSSS